jgi:L-ascorbate metabolism protein UlaG (beta-lactamase superfamily)
MMRAATAIKGLTSMKHLFAIITTSLGLFNTAIAHDSATATYLGNEGVMVVHGETKVLFDAFYADSFGQYALVPDTIAEAMMKGAPPYDGVDAIFVSHVHGDHFTAEPAVAYMRANPTVRLYAPQQVHDAIVNSGVADNDPLMARVFGYNLGPEDSAIGFDVDGLQVAAVAIPHSGNRPHIQNFAWRVTLGEETTVMHLGDAGTVVSDFSRHMQHFKSRKTNTAFPPYWFYGDTNGEMILRDIIDADRTIGVHVPKRAAGDGDKWRARAGGDLFTNPGETRDLIGK